MNEPIILVMAAASAAAFVAAVYQIVSDLFLRDRARVNERVDVEMLKRQAAGAAAKVKKASLFKNLDQMDAAARAASSQTTWSQAFESMVEQSGLDVTPGRLLTIAGGASAALGALAFFIQGSPLHGVMGAVIAGVLPIWYVKRCRDARMEKLRSQLPDAFDLMARVVRAGQSLGQAVLGVAEEFPQPISTEFAYCYEQQNLGLSPEVAFRELTRRTGVIELKIFVLAVLVQQQTGGNLAEMLAKLANVVRERYRIRGAISALTAEGRMQGWVLAGMPPVMILILLVMNYNYAIALFEHPDVLAATFGAELVGILWIRKIVNFEF
ncbi:type II secretion system F family protein [Paludisphaera rhizosphaerae]|uniref:type II secretion system F family protein n=1 Tax=Paludisphaera rhizosphaerae TaxID=2711216 RepID=UPI0013EC426E|nr:type II secretion system F family protein [Paludisphaera rhizosphaerae]